MFTQELDLQASEDIQIENLLRSAVEREELEVFYQPRVELATGRVCSLEALARWRNGALGWVDPCKFIPVAERAGLIGQLGDWVLRRACKDLRYLTDLGYANLGVSVNLSHCQLTEPGLVASVCSALQEFSLDPRRLELELTEAAIARDVGQAVQIMECLEKAGISIAIDDFGTGYSSLSKLRCFPIRTLKIDRVFVSSLPNDSASSLIARRNDAGHGILRQAGDQKRRMMLNRSSGTYLHPNPPQTIACSAFYEVTISAKPQHFELQPHLNGKHCAVTADNLQPQEFHLRDQKACPNKRGHLFPPPSARNGPSCPARTLRA